MNKPNYSLNIFINCPFDKEYIPLMNALLFTIYYCGYIPRCALEQSNSGDVRYKKILKLIDDSEHGIHDISRTQLDQKLMLPRFNMPFELGLFLGAKELGTKRHQTKNCLILDKEQHRYQKFLSDLAGNDIKAHQNNVKNIIKVVRDWIASFSPTSKPAGTHIASQYQSFTKALPTMKKELLSTASRDIEYGDYSMLISEWLKDLTKSNLPAKKAQKKKPSARRSFTHQRTKNTVSKFSP